MSKPIVAVVGRPNVGKSTLFNKLCGQRLAIVEDTPGITRDRIFANCEWSGHEFLLVDTGGIEPKATEGILAHMREQAQIAIDTADCIIMVVDVRNGLTAADEDVAHMLRRSHKPIILAVNKCDNVGDTPMELYEFYNLGFDEVMPISSVHGHGTGDLLDAVCAHLDFSETVVEEDRIPVAIIGRPNVGKSSLTNRILGENRMIVANEAGTTRDAIDTPVDNAYGKFIFTDTAGLRKRSNITDGLERYMVVRALAAVERSRVALILVDATVGFTEHMLLMKKCEDNGWFAANPENAENFGVAIMTGDYDLRDKYAEDYEVKVLSTPTLTEDVAYAAMFAVSAYTANFDRAMEVITLLNTNAEAKNLLQYGIEGTNYELDDDGALVYLNDAYRMNNLYTGNALLSYPAPDEAADSRENGKAANRDSRVSPYFGLSDVADEIDTQLVEDMRTLSDTYMARMYACANATELADFFENAKTELYADPTYKAAFSVGDDSKSPYAVYARWFEKLWPSAE